MTNGASPVSCSEDLWKDDFLVRYGLCHGIKGHCEVTEGGIHPKCMNEDNHEYLTKKEYIKMHCLRIGKYKNRGVTVKATAQINNDQFHSTSITFNHRHRSARRRLFNDIRGDFTKYLFDDRIDEVMRWVEMTDERIFKTYKIVRAAYHGGDDFNGVNIITLMQKSQEIMTEIQQLMIEHKRNHTTEEEIKTLCTEVRTALVLWDDVFSKANTKYESTTVDWVTKHCNETEKSIAQAMFQMRSMGFSITPKMHGLECHLVHLMRTTPGGTYSSDD